MLCFALMETCSFSSYVQTAFLSLGMGKQEDSAYKLPVLSYIMFDYLTKLMIQKT